VTRVSDQTRRKALEALCAIDLGGAVEDLTPEVHALLEGVAAHADEIDTQISAHAERWKLSRMPTVDRNLLRLGAYEVLHGGEEPKRVIGGVVRLAKMLSTEDSGRFVHALLAAVARDGARQSDS
jgi:transcription antitermination protein NusB